MVPAQGFRRAILCSIAEEDFRDLMRSDAWARNAPMIGQDDDRALGIEKTDDVVGVGAEAAPMRDVAQTRKYIRHPAETIANWRAVVGCAGGKGLLQRDFWDEAFGIQSLIPEKQIGERRQHAAGCCQQRSIMRSKSTGRLSIIPAFINPGFRLLSPANSKSAPSSVWTSSADAWWCIAAPRESRSCRAPGAHILGPTSRSANSSITRSAAPIITGGSTRPAFAPTFRPATGSLRAPGFSPIRRPRPGGSSGPSMERSRYSIYHASPGSKSTSSLSKPICAASARFHIGFPPAQPANRRTRRDRGARLLDRILHRHCELYATRANYGNERIRAASSTRRSRQFHAVRRCPRRSAVHAQLLRRRRSKPWQR